MQSYAACAKLQRELEAKLHMQTGTVKLGWTETEIETETHAETYAETYAEVKTETEKLNRIPKLKSQAQT